jgi:hypothetical protein
MVPLEKRCQVKVGFRCREKRVQRFRVQGSEVLSKSEYPPAMRSALGWCNH